MTLQTIEPVLYLPDDTPFFAEPGDVGHAVRLVWRALGLLALCLLAYIPALIWGGLVWQDEIRVTQNMFLWSWSGLAGMWAHATVGRYQPLAQTILWAEHHWFRTGPRGYHVVSVVFHAVDAGLLWMVLRRLGVRGAWLGAALFAVHPVEVQSVAWISQQSHLVGAGFFLGSVWAFLRLSRVFPPPLEQDGQQIEADAYDWDELLGYEPVKRLYAASIGLALAAVLSDPLAVSLPLVLLLLVWWKRGRLTWVDWARLAPFFVIAIAGAATIWAIVSRSPAVDIGMVGPPLAIVQRLGVCCHAIWAYAANVVWPYPLLFIYNRWNAMDNSQIAFAAALIAVIAAACALRKWIGRGPFVAILLFIVLLFPALGAVLASSAPPIYLADHWEYLAAAVPIAAVAWALVEGVSRFSSATLVRSLRVAAAVACISGLGFLSLIQTRSYEDEESAWRQAIDHDPASSLAVSGYTRLLLQQGRAHDALMLVQDAEQSGASDVSLRLSQAQVYLAEERYGDAIRCFIDAHKICPDDPQISLGLADAYARNGQPDQAMRTYDQVLKLHPNDAVAQFDVGRLLEARGKLDEAIERYKLATKANPRFLLPKLNLVHCYELRGEHAKSADAARADFASSLEQLNEVIAQDPRNFTAIFDAGTILFGMRDFPHAEQIFQVAVTINPKSAEAWDRLGITRAAQGRQRLSEAVFDFDRAVRLKADYTEAQQHLEEARRELAAMDKAKPLPR